MKFLYQIKEEHHMFQITLKEITSETIISQPILNYNYGINSMMSIIGSTVHFINHHNLFQKPIVELRMPNCLAGKFLDEIASKMPNSTRNTFSKLRIIDAYRIFGYDGWDWKLISVLNHL